MAKQAAQPKTMARQAAPAAPAAGTDFQRFPAVKYRKVKPSVKYPNGYEVKRVADEAEEAALGPEWKDSPEGMSPKPKPIDDDA